VRNVLPHTLRVTRHGSKTIKLIRGFIKTLSRGPLEPGSAGNDIVLAGYTFGQVAAEHELCVGMTSFGRGREPFLRCLPIQGQSLPVLV